MSRILTITENGFNEEIVGNSSNLTAVIIGELEEVKSVFYKSLPGITQIGSRYLGLAHNNSDWDHIIPMSKFSNDSFVGKCFNMLNTDFFKSEYSWLPDNSKLYTLEFYESYDLTRGFPYGQNYHKIQLLVLPDDEFDIQLKNNQKVKQVMDLLFNDIFLGSFIRNKLMELKIVEVFTKVNNFFDPESSFYNTEKYKTDDYFVTRKVNGLGSLFFKTVLYFIENNKDDPNKFINNLLCNQQYSTKVFTNDKNSTEYHNWGYSYAKPIMDYLISNFGNIDFESIISIN